MSQEIFTQTETATDTAGTATQAAATAQPRAVAQPRVTATSATKQSTLDARALVLVAVLLAAGAILKLTLGSVLNFAGMKPNFIIAMYCLAILLVRPKPLQAGIIGLIAGLVCQIPLLAATPLINIASETLGGLVMGLLIAVPLKLSKVDAQPLVATFLATVVSGYTFVLILAAINGIALPVAVVTYAIMVFGTATFNCILVQVLVVPLRAVLKK